MGFPYMQPAIHIFAYTYPLASEDRCPPAWERVTDSSYAAYKGEEGLISEVLSMKVLWRPRDNTFALFT